MEILFPYFGEALDFLKKISVGKVQRVDGSDLFCWSPDGAGLTFPQQELVLDESGIKHVWTDEETGLSWLIGGRISRYSGFLVETLNKCNYAGFSDWRCPSLQELKTLSSNQKDEFGVFVKGALSGRISGNYTSTTRHHHWSESAWWNFNDSSATTEDYKESEIIWGSQGQYAGMTRGYSRNSATTILVRGTDKQDFDDWELRLLAWAEKNQAFDFPSTKKNIRELESLRFTRFSEHEKLPVELAKLPRLSHLTTKLRVGEEFVFAIDGLVDLNIGSEFGVNKDSIDLIPPEIACLKNLLSFRANNLGIKHISNEIGSLAKLVSIDISGNNFENLPPTIGGLGSLQEAYFGNKLKAVPDTIGNLKALRKLVLVGSFDSLPESFGGLASLQELLIRSEMKFLPESFGQLQCLETLTLYLKNCEMLSFNFSELEHLEKIVCEMPLKVFPFNFHRLQRLKHLEIRGGNLQCLPEAIGEMRSLRTLVISDSPLMKLDDEIGNLSELEVLSLAGSKISEIPKSILNLENLRTLNVSSTSINSLPEWLQELKSLKRIKADGAIFPPGLKQLRSFF